MFYRVQNNLRVANFREWMEKQGIPPATWGPNNGDANRLGPRYYDFEFFRLISTFTAVFIFLNIIAAATFRAVQNLKECPQCFTSPLIYNERARLLQSLVLFFCFSLKIRECVEIFVQFVQPNEYLGNASKLLQRVPPFSFYFLNVTYKTGSFGAVKLLSSKCPPTILLKSPVVMSRVKRYIRTFDVISKLYCVFVRKRRRSENKNFS